MHGLVVGGETVRIAGRDLGDAIDVKFGTVAAELFAVKMTDEGGVVIDAISPCGPKGLVPVTVTSRRGTSAIVIASRFNYSLPAVLGTVSFGTRTVGVTGAPMTATIPLKLSSTDLPQDMLVTPFSMGDPLIAGTLRTVLQAAGLGPQFTVGQFVATFGNATVEYTVSKICPAARGWTRF